MNILKYFLNLMFAQAYLSFGVKGHTFRGTLVHPLPSPRPPPSRTARPPRLPVTSTAGLLGLRAIVPVRCTSPPSAVRAGVNALPALPELPPPCLGGTPGSSTLLASLKCSSDPVPLRMDRVTSSFSSWALTNVHVELNLN